MQSSAEKNIAWPGLFWKLRTVYLSKCLCDVSASFHLEERKDFILFFFLVRHDISKHFEIKYIIPQAVIIFWSTWIVISFFINSHHFRLCFLWTSFLWGHVRLLIVLQGRKQELFEGRVLGQRCFLFSFCYYLAALWSHNISRQCPLPESLW